jgi:hypothetical protein
MSRERGRSVPAPRVPAASIRNIGEAKAKVNSTPGQLYLLADLGHSNRVNGAQSAELPNKWRVFIYFLHFLCLLCILQ